jgi:ATP-dependent protease ClpP protease subunit
MQLGCNWHREFTLARVYISFSAEIDLKTTETLIAVTFQQIQQGATELYYLFSTPGGQVAQGIALYNTLKALPVPTIMHNVGNVDSIGNAIFLAGKKRYACPGSTFMFHGVGFDVPAGARIEQAKAEEFLHGILAEQKKIGTVIAHETSLEGKDIKGLFRKAQTKDAHFALNKGIIHEIREAEIPVGAATIALVFQR